MTPRKEIGIRELKNSASKVISEVKETEGEYVVTRRGEPVAVLRPVRKGEIEEEETRARIDSLIDRIERTARAVASAASQESAAAAVSRQRR